MTRLPLTLLACCAVLAWPMAAPAAVATTAPVATPAHDPAKIAVAVEILENLRTVDIAKSAGTRSLMSDPHVAALSPADQLLLGQFFASELDKRHDEMLKALAADNVDRFTLDQLTQILVFSRISFVQQTAMAAADPTLPTPDPSKMSEQEWKDFNSIGNADYTADFLNNFDFSSETRIVGEAVTAAIQRLSASHTPKG